MESLRDTATEISARLLALDVVDLIADGTAIPVIAFALRDDAGFSVFDVSHELRARGWQVPAYTMPADATDVAVLRIVIRDGFNADLGTRLADDIEAVCSALAKGRQPVERNRSHFAH